MKHYDSLAPGLTMRTWW